MFIFMTYFNITKHKSFSKCGAIFASSPVAIVKQLFMGPWGQCIIHATLQPVWRTYRSDIHEWANRYIVNHGSGGDVREYLCIQYEISMGNLIDLCTYTFSFKQMQMFQGISFAGLKGILT